MSIKGLLGVRFAWCLSIGIHATLLLSAGVVTSRGPSAAHSGGSLESAGSLTLDLRTSARTRPVLEAPAVAETIACTSESATSATEARPPLQGTPLSTVPVSPDELPSSASGALLQPQPVLAAPADLASARAEIEEPLHLEDDQATGAQHAAASREIPRMGPSSESAAAAPLARGSASNPATALDNAGSAPSAARVSAPAPQDTGSGTSRGETRAAAVAGSPRIKYPEISRRLGEEGRVVCRLSVRADGTVAEVTIVVSSGHARLDEAARRGLKDWVCRPSLRDGVNVASEIEHTVHFRLD